MSTFGSLFAGIGGFDLGLERAGWTNIWQVEIDDWRRQVLARHWPDVPRWGDIQTFPPFKDPDWKVDLICGGFPCQDLSTAGKRAGLSGERSGLFFEFARVVALLQPQWILVENVPGLLSSHEGQDMGIVLETLSKLRYGLSWRVLDSQYFGVPQRRRRIYIVGHLGGPCPSEVLFEPEGGGRDSQAREEARQEVARPLGSGASRGRAKRQATIHRDNDTYILETAHRGGNQTGYRRGATYAVSATQAVARPLRANRWGGSDSHGDEGDIIVGTLLAPNPSEGSRSDKRPIVCTPSDTDGVRETTGVPGWLDPCPRCPDGRHYAALGDAVTVNVIEWIGRRLLVAHRNNP